MGSGEGWIGVVCSGVGVGVVEEVEGILVVVVNLVEVGSAIGVVVDSWEGVVVFEVPSEVVVVPLEEVV